MTVEEGQVRDRMKARFLRSVKAEEVFARAALLTGKPIELYREMAPSVLASMLTHAMKSPGRIVWSAAEIYQGSLYLEVELSRPVHRAFELLREILTAPPDRRDQAVETARQFVEKYDRARRGRGHRAERRGRTCGE